MSGKKKYEHLLPEMVKLREQGDSVYSISKKLNITNQTIKRYLDGNDKKDLLFTPEDCRRTVTPPSLIVNDLKVMAVILVALFGVILLFRWVF